MSFDARKSVALTCGAVIIAAALAAPSLAQVGAVLRDVEVRGVTRIEPSTVERYLSVRRGERITAEGLNDSVRRLFETGLFSDAAIDVRGGKVIVTVAENPSINRVAFEGNDVVDDDQLRALITSQPRRALTRARVEADAQAITELYRRTGRYGATVEPKVVDLPQNRADLVFEIVEGEVTNVESITFVGNEVYSDRRLRGVIETSENGLLGFFVSTDTYDPDRLNYDKELLRQYYLERGYADFSVLSSTAELAPDNSGFYLTFTVAEGERYDFGAQTVSSSQPELDPAEFESLIDGDQGDVYDASLVEKNIERMTFLAGQKGYAFTRILPRAMRDSQAREIGIVYELVEGPRVYVERIDIEGNSRTLDRVIRRQFSMAEGDAFDSQAIKRARDRIRALGYFSKVEVVTEQGSAPDRAVVRVTVEEKSTGSFNIGAGFSTADGLLLDVNLTERNFLGRGQFLRLRGTAAAEKQIYDITFREPAFLDRDLGVGFRGYFVQEDLSSSSSFEQTSIGFTPSVDFPVSEYGRLTLSYSISQDEIRDVDTTASPFILRDAGKAITSQFSYGYVYDRRNDPVTPTSGYILSFGQDFAGFGGDTRFVRTRASGRISTAFFDEEVVASVELEGGAIVTLGDDLRVTDRFFLGGDSFRGFQNQGLGPRDRNTGDALGGNYFVMLRNQVTFPLGLPEEIGIYGGLFTDIGALWGLDTATVGATTVDEGANLRVSVGASLFWDTGFGPLRVNFAWPLVDEEGDKREWFRLTASTRF